MPKLPNLHEMYRTSDDDKSDVFHWVMFNITYKPGYLIKDQGIHLTIESTQPDARTLDGGDLVPIVGRYLIPKGIASTLDEKKILDWLFDCIVSYERHEAQEWFRCDGRLVADPHEFEIKTSELKKRTMQHAPPTY